ncbi:hypothetical protein [uncultured Desulfovibrio sp.]|uniref:hypothetical protein n=1 Tax=uncultured Desulfovibrio sp. TaxID=167968 RepID=UPI0026733957|nr:hypothetical protein [uncultured Desulfovibrio sp.]
MPSRIKKTAFWLGRQIKKFLAIDDGARFAKTLPRPRKLFEYHKKQLQENISREEALTRKDFAEILRQWGITTENLDLVLKERRQMRRMGYFLLLFGLGLDIWQTFLLQQSLYWRTLQGFFALSLTFLGILMVLACTWRIQVLTKRRFVPFLEWLRRKGRI